jgi:hypothetical protein
MFFVDFKPVSLDRERSGHANAVAVVSTAKRASAARIGQAPRVIFKVFSLAQRPAFMHNAVAVT